MYEKYLFSTGGFCWVILNVLQWILKYKQPNEQEQFTPRIIVYILLTIGTEWNWRKFIGPLLHIICPLDNNHGVSDSLQRSYRATNPVSLLRFYREFLISVVAYILPITVLVEIRENLLVLYFTFLLWITMVFLILFDGATELLAQASYFVSIGNF